MQAAATLADAQINFNDDLQALETAARIVGVAYNAYTLNPVGAGFGTLNAFRDLYSHEAEKSRLMEISESANFELQLRRSKYPYAGANDQSLPAQNYNGISGDDIKEGLTDYKGDPIDYYTLNEARTEASIDECFKSDTPIQMWPTDPTIQPRADGSYDEELVLSQVWENPSVRSKLMI